MRRLLINFSEQLEVRKNSVAMVTSHRVEIIPTSLGIP